MNNVEPTSIVADRRTYHTYILRIERRQNLYAGMRYHWELSDQTVFMDKDGDLRKELRYVANNYTYTKAGARRQANRAMDKHYAGLKRPLDSVVSAQTLAVNIDEGDRYERTLADK